MGRFRRVQQVIAVLVVFAFSNTALAADDFYENTELPARLVPEYKPCTVSGVRYACYTQEQMVEIFAFEARAKYWHTQWQSKKSILLEKELQIEKLDKIIDLALAINQRDDDFVSQLSADYMDMAKLKNEFRAKAENPPTWPLWLGGAGLAVGLGALLLAAFK